LDGSASGQSFPIDADNYYTYQILICHLQYCCNLTEQLILLNNWNDNCHWFACTIQMALLHVWEAVLRGVIVIISAAARWTQSSFGHCYSLSLVNGPVHEVSFRQCSDTVGWVTGQAFDP